MGVMGEELRERVKERYAGAARCSREAERRRVAGRRASGGWTPKR